MSEIPPDRSLSLLIVILNYRTPDLTIACLKSVAAELPALPKTRVVVTDNASGDNSVERIGAAIAAQGWQAWAELMPLERNGGYAFGNNAAIRPLQESGQLPPYVLLLNPDTLVRPGGVQHLLEFMEAHPEVGIAGSRLEDLDGTPQRSAFRFPSLPGEFESGVRFGPVTQLLCRWMMAPPVSDEPHRTDWVAGASMMVRRAVFEAIGLLDEGYFMYFEEVDFCLRANRSGWLCWYVPQSHVVHFVGQSSGVTDTKRPPKRMPPYWFDSRRRFYLKNYGWLYAALTDAIWMVGFTLWRWRRLVQRKPDLDPPKFWSDFLLNSVFLKGGQV
jgi:GT2 family glycosyltransferase